MPVVAGPLPVEDVLAELAAALELGGVAVLTAPPGAGKSTGVPPYLLQTSWLAGRRLLLLEPRRLAARAVAQRMAAVLGQDVGDVVGYRVRGDTRVSDRTRIEVVTEGVLTRVIQADPALSGVGLVIFDEFHERSLDADLGLALCLEARAALAPELRVLAMSATLDVEPLAALLGGTGPAAPVIRSDGRQHPVTTHWSAPLPGERWDVAVARLVRRAVAETEGDVLVFLPGVGDIGRVTTLLSAGDGPFAERAIALVTLHGGLSWQDQDAALGPDPAGRRKVVLATAIAETSLTIDGIAVVVDGGRARVARYDARRGLGHLQTVAVSAGSAEQRRGRAGRQRPGVCYRLWSEADQRTLAVHQAPDILVGDLTPLALELARWGSPDGLGLAWLDPPPPGHLQAGRQLLQQLGLADPAGRLTADGRAAVELGVHPRLGRLLTGALAAGQAAAVVGCALAALLGDRDPFGNDASTADVRERLVSLDRFPRLVAEARRLRNRLGVRAASGRSGRLDLDHVGPLLALAYPDRLAARRSDGSVRYRLAGGGGAALAPNDPLRHEKLLVVADLDGVGGRADGRIRLAAPVDEADLPGEVATVDRVFWDAAAGDVRGRRERRVAGLTLSSSPLAELPAAPVAEALLAGVCAEGWSVLSEPPSLRRWRQRVLFCRHIQGERWPELSEAALLASLESWLLPFLAGCRRRADLARVDLASALHALVPWAQTRELEGLAPAALTVPTGREVALDYADDQPVLAVKLQECFGWTVTPTVAGGAVAVVLHLLSPAGRPLAITADLASFWAGPYHDVRRELRGRYPKHRWPEDPLAAEPGRR